MNKFVSTLLIFMFFAAVSVFAETADHSKWPAKLMHPDMPVYKAGKFKGWNLWNNTDAYGVFMLIDGTNQADLDKYVIQLKAAGFEGTGSGAYHKGLYDIKIQFNSKTILQISSDKVTVVDWPKALLNGIPEQKKGALTQVTKPSEDMPDYVQLYYINLTRDDLEPWFKDLEKAGFAVDGDMATKAGVSLQGKSYQSLNIQVSENGANEWMVDFSYSNE